MILRFRRKLLGINEPYKRQKLILQYHDSQWKFRKSVGLSRDLNPGPPAPKAGIIPLDHWAIMIIDPCNVILILSKYVFVVACVSCQGQQVFDLLSTFGIERIFLILFLHINLIFHYGYEIENKSNITM